LVYIIPCLINAWNVILIRSYILNLPISLQEAARIDGANDITIFFQIILPLCLPVMATIMLFIAVSQWNDWISTYLYMTGTSKIRLSTLQFELMKVLDNVNASGKSDIHFEGLKLMKRNPESIKMAITVVCTAPILIVYPFIQRYFVTGITLGSMKE
jgi:putative aldouronate transport system permease protein